MIKTELRPYQDRARFAAASALTGGGGFLLIPEQRTGKCLISLAVVADIRPKYILVICPKVAIPVWKKQRQLHVEGKDIPMTVVNYEEVTNNRKRWYLWCRERKDVLVICDESHLIKSRGASRSRVVRHIGRLVKYRLALTGTPIAQGLQDAWAQFDFIDPKIFGKFDDTIDKKTEEILEIGFNSRHIIWGGYKKHQIVGYREQEKFEEIFHRHSFRITLREAKKEGGKPPLRLYYRKEGFDLERKAQKIYEDLEKELEAEVNQKKIRVKNVLSCVMKLQQVTGGCLIENVVSEDDPPIETKLYHQTGREKIEKLHEVTRSLRARMKFIVICRFLHEIETVKLELQKHLYSVAIVAGGSPYDGVFATDAIVMQIQSGMAVDMSKADVIIFYSTDYSYLNFEQSRFRILSYDKGTGKYIFLLANNTIDGVIYEAVSRKKKLADLVIDKYRQRRGHRT